MYCGWPAANPPSADWCLQPSSWSWETTLAPTSLRSVGGSEVRPETDSSAMPCLTWAASQRRVTTGGPIRMPKAPWARRWAAIGSSQPLRSSLSQSTSGPSGR